jgi:hypothetical protein
MNTTYYDHRAERTVAAADAEQRRAAAATTWANVELQRVRIASARAELTDRQLAAAARHRQEQRRDRRTERAEWRADVRSGLANIRRWFATVVPLLVGAVAMGAPILIGWDGQLLTARTVLHLGLLAWVFPVAIEGGAWWLAFLQHRAIRRHVPAGRLRFCIWLLALAAAGMNVWRGTLAYGPVGGVGLGLASLLGIGLWEITAWYLRWSASDRTGRQARLSLARWLRFPRLAFAAWSIGLAHGIGADPDTAWCAAWIYRYGVGPDAIRRDRRLGRLVVRAVWQADSAAARAGDLIVVNGIILRPLVPLPVAHGGTEPSAQSIELSQLSPLAADRLPTVLRAIANGALPEHPGTKAIYRLIGGGMATAIEIRKHLDSLTRTTAEEVAR